MARNTTKNFIAANQFPFANRFGFSTSIGNNIDHDMDNNKPVTVSDAADITSIEAFRVDLDNRFQHDRAVHVGERLPLTFNLAANASQATQTFFIADRPMTITAIQEVHATLGTDPGAVTGQVFKDTGTQAPGTGVAVMSNTFNFKGTINTPQQAVMNAVDGSGNVPASVQLAAGDRLSIVYTGVLTALAGVVLTVSTTPGYKEAPAVYYVAANGTLATQSFFMANKDMVVTSVNAIWSAAGTDAGSVSIDVFHDTGTNAPGAGTSILTAAMNGKAAANTLVTPALTATAAQLKLSAGDRLSVKYTGTLTTLAGVVIVVYCQSSSAVVGTPLTGYYGQMELNYNMNANGSLIAASSFFVADRDYFLNDASVIWSTANAAGTWDLTIDKGTNAPGAGTSCLSAPVATTTTANTTSVPTLNVSTRTRMVSQGDRVTLKLNTIGALAGVVANVSLIPW